MTLEAVVVLGCQLGPDGKPGAAAGRRVARGASAWRQHRAGLVLVTGGRRWHGVAEAAALRDALIARHGVPAQVIATEWCSLSTAENARYSAEFLRFRGISRVGIVTCDWHLPRALASFRATGLEPVGIAARTPPTSWPRQAWRRMREHGAWVFDRQATWGWGES